MSFLGRKFARSKWQNSSIDGDQPSADAITGCLKTNNNTLSFWRCDGDDKVNAKRVVLAMASLGDRCDKFHVVLIPESDLNRLDLTLQDERGDTPIEDLIEEHVNVVRLNGERLLSIGELLAAQTKSQIGCHTFTKADVKTILKDAIESGRLPASRLTKKMRINLGVTAFTGWRSYLKERVGMFFSWKSDFN